ncbi:MAG TPA: VOC family protein [Pyrinomonadaceae bacterium]
MKRVTGIGGIFFKSKDPKALQEWYRKHLGIESADEEGATFKWREHDDPSKEGWTQWTPFPHDTEYFEPTKVPFMINYRVDDLDGLLAALREEGVAVSDKIESHDYGRFTWITDLEGNRVELWEPAKE